MPLVWEDGTTSSYYKLEFVCETAGVATVEVALDGVDVIGSPFAILFSPGATDPEKSILSGPGITGGIIDQKTPFQIDASDSYGNSRGVGGDNFVVVIQCTTTCARTPDVEVNDLGTGIYDVEYTLYTVGVFTLQVKLNDQDVGLLPVKSPIVVTSKESAGAIDISTSEVVGLQTQVQAGSTQMLKVVALDSEGYQLTEGGESFSVSIDALDPSKPDLIKAFDADYLNGTYSVEYVLEHTGDYQVTVLHSKTEGNTVVQSLVGTSTISYPFAFESIPGVTSHSESYLLANPIQSEINVGSSYTIKVQSVDQFSNTQIHRTTVEDPWVFVATHVTDVNVRAVEAQGEKGAGDGVYDVTFQLPVIGLYDVALYLGSPESSVPLGLDRIEGIGGLLDPSQVYTLDYNSMNAKAGETVAVSFAPRDVAGNVITSLAEVPLCEVLLDGIATGTSCSYTDDGNFTAKFHPTVSGKSTLSIQLDGVHILGSPFTGIQIEAGDVTSAALGTAATSFEVGEEVTTLVSLFDAHGNEITNGGQAVLKVLLQSGDTSTAAFVENFGNGTYLTTFTVGGVGTSTLVVTTAERLAANQNSYLSRSISIVPLPTSAADSFLEPSTFFDGTSFGASAGETIAVTIRPVNKNGALQSYQVSDAFEVTLHPSSSYLGSVIDTIASKQVEYDTDGAPAGVGYTFRFAVKKVLDTGFLLNVTLDGVPIAGAPFAVSASPGQASAEQSNIYSGDYVYAESLGSFGSMAGVGRKFLLQLRDSYGNDLVYNPYESAADQLSIQLAEGHQINQTVTTLADGRYEMFYSSSQAGQFTLQALLDSAVIGSGSAIVVIAGENHYANFNVYGPGITADVVVAESITSTSMPSMCSATCVRTTAPR